MKYITIGIFLLKMRMKKNQKLSEGGLGEDVNSVNSGYEKVLDDLKICVYFAYLNCLTSSNEQILLL